MIKIQFARKLRQNPTPEEEILWNLLRRKGFMGLKFRRQHPIQYGTRQEFFIADFYCAKKKIIIELDGIIHQRTKAYDHSRDWILEQMGYKVFRLLNSEVYDQKILIKKLKVIFSPGPSPFYEDMD